MIVCPARGVRGLSREKELISTRTLARAGLPWLAAGLCACGGGDDTATPGTPIAPQQGPGTLYVGHYREDPNVDAADPGVGAMTLKVPDAYRGLTRGGSLDFAFAACQNSQVTSFDNTRDIERLSGTWSGMLDGSAQSGSYSGEYDDDTKGYFGAYTNAGGTQTRDLSPCTRYTIAAKGFWQVNPVGAEVSKGFKVDVAQGRVAWSAPSGTPAPASVLVYLVDPRLAEAGTSDPVLWQAVVDGSATSAPIPPALALGSKRDYIAVVTTFAPQRFALKSGSKKFQPGP